MIDLQLSLTKLPTDRLKFLQSRLVDAGLAFDNAKTSAEGKRRAQAIFAPLRDSCKGHEKKVYAALCTAKPDTLDLMIKRLVEELA